MYNGFEMFSVTETVTENYSVTDLKCFHVMYFQVLKSVEVNESSASTHCILFLNWWSELFKKRLIMTEYDYLIANWKLFH
jgi:hypothetical protein